MFQCIIYSIYNNIIKHRDIHVYIYSLTSQMYFERISGKLIFKGTVRRARVILNHRPVKSRFNSQPKKKLKLKHFVYSTCRKIKRDDGIGCISWLHCLLTSLVLLLFIKEFMISTIIIYNVTEYFLVENVGNGVNEVQISDYTGPNGVQWDLTVDEYVQENSEGGVDTYPTFQSVNVRL